jgi:hypothetical protein
MIDIGRYDESAVHRSGPAAPKQDFCDGLAHSQVVEVNAK